jgi:hypothetical protein
MPIGGGAGRCPAVASMHGRWWQFGAEAMIDGSVGGWAGWAELSASHQRPVWTSRWPWRMTSEFRRIWTLCCVNLASNPLSQNWLMECGALSFRDGNTWARCASRGRSGMSTLAVCVDLMIVLLGSRTCGPLVLGSLLTHGLVAWRKWPVQPERAHAVSWDGWEDELEELGRLFSLTLEFNPLACRSVLRMTHSLFTCEPPMLLSRVAACLWPAAGLVQVLLLWLLATF